MSETNTGLRIEYKRSHKTTVVLPPGHMAIGGKLMREEDFATEMRAKVKAWMAEDSTPIEIGI